MESSLAVLVSQHIVIGLVSICLIFAGVQALRNIKGDSPFCPYLLELLGLTFILPAVLLFSLTVKISPEAIMGLLGTIVGYIFGTSRNSQRCIDQTKRQQTIDKA